MPAMPQKHPRAAACHSGAIAPVSAGRNTSPSEPDGAVAAIVSKSSKRVTFKDSHEPFHGAPRQPARILDEVIACGIGMRFNKQGCIKGWRMKQGSHDFAGPDRHAHAVDVAQA